MRALDMQFTPFFALGCSGIRGCLEVRRFRMFMPGLNKEQRTQPQRSRRRLENRKRGAFALGLVISLSRWDFVIFTECRSTACSCLYDIAEFLQLDISFNQFFSRSFLSV